VLEHVAEHGLAWGPGRLRVGIDGHTAPGKTSFGDELAEQISSVGRLVLRASLDDFKKPWRDRHLYDRESGEGSGSNATICSAASSTSTEPRHEPSFDTPQA
jgi:uridine kinase